MLEPLLFSDLAIISAINVVYINSAIAFSGIIANIINIFVYAKMDHNDTTNISLLALSVSDLCSLVVLVSICSSHYSYYHTGGLLITLLEIKWSILGHTYFYFKRVSNWILAFITCERCLCIVQPIKVRDIITPRRSVATLVIICVILAALLSPLYAFSILPYVLISETNQTLPMVANAGQMLDLESLIYGVSFALTILTLIWVIVCTCILVIALRRNTSWRAGAAGTQTSEKLSTRDKKVTKMIILLLLIFLVPFFPDCCVLFAQAVVQELSFEGRYTFLYLCIVTLMESLYALHASVNIVVYVNMSSKYREALKIYLSSGLSWCAKLYCFKT